MLVDKDESVLGSAVAIQTFVDLLGFNPHINFLVSDGYFYGDSKCKVASEFHLRGLEALLKIAVFIAIAELVEYSKTIFYKNFFLLFFIYCHFLK